MTGMCTYRPMYIYIYIFMYMNVYVHIGDCLMVRECIAVFAR